jgi:conjugative transfer signal peptidase TraF
MKRLPIFMLGLCVVSTVAIASHAAKELGFTLNYTPSLPIGLYCLRPIDTIQPGMLVSLHVPAEVRPLVYGRHYLKTGADLIKPVAAIHGDTVCLTDTGLFINGQYHGPVYTADSRGNLLPRIRWCHRLDDDQIFLASDYSKSFDSRYFGAVERTELLYEAVPVLTF